MSKYTKTDRPTDYVYSDIWKFGKVLNHISDDAIEVLFESGRHSTLSYSHYRRKNMISFVRMNRITDEGFALSEEQSRVFDLLEESENNVFVTGKAGTGKSVVLRYFVQNTKKNIAVLASTGIAALNIDGQTLHSYFKMDGRIQCTETVSLVKNLTDAKKGLSSRTGCDHH